MADVVREGEDFVVAAEVIGAALLVAPGDVQGMLRSGAIRTVTEMGVEEDAGRWRLSFVHGQRRLRLVVDGDGGVVTRSVVDFGSNR